MKNVVKGRVVDEATGNPVYGASVELMAAGTFKCGESSRQRTSRSGAFSFALKGADSAVLRVRDLEGAELGEWRLEPKALGEQLLTLKLKAGSLKCAKLPRQPEGKRLVPESVIHTISLAADAAERVKPKARPKELLAEYLRALPPLWSATDLTDLAAGVLAGRSADYRLFRDRLHELALWSLRQGHEPRQLGQGEAEQLVSPGALEKFGEKVRSLPRRRSALVAHGQLDTLAAATIRVNQRNLPGMHRGLGFLDHQLCPLSTLHLLHEGALAALAGGLDEMQGFIERLEGFAGAFPGDIPGVPDLPPRPGSRSPRPIPLPCPDGGFWPPPLGGLPWLGDLPPERAEMWACMAELLPRIFREGVSRRTQYTITGVSPERACPGDEIVISGTNLRFEGHSGVVLFQGSERGTTIEAPVSSWTDTEITVTVPDGAVCGDLELSIPDSRVYVPGCADLQLFYGPLEPFHFDGGASLVEFFLPSSEDRCHHDSGSSVAVGWRSTCTVDQVTVRMIDDEGTELYSAAVGPSSGTVTLALPSYDSDRDVLLELRGGGPCGEHTYEAWHLRVRRRVPEGTALFAGVDFENWHRNIVRPGVPTVWAWNLERLVDAVRRAGIDGVRLGVKGTGFSFENCVTGMLPAEAPPPWLIKTDVFREPELPEDPDASDIIQCEVFGVLSEAVLREPRSVLDDTTLAAFVPRTEGCDSEDESDWAVPAPLNPVRARLIHVKAGAKLAHLNCLLHSKGLAFATLGGTNGQSIAGAISTGTHGTNVDLPPIQDFVRALKLVGPGGVQWWIEPRTDPVTDRSEMERLKREKVLDPCLRLVYDDALFNACLVSLGAAGVIHELVLEAVPSHRLRSVTHELSWAQARETLREIVAGETEFFAEFVLGPRAVRYTTREPVSCASSPRQGGDVGDTLTAIAWLALQAPVLLGAIPGIVAELGAALLSPIPIPGLPDFTDIPRHIDALNNLVAALPALIDALDDLDPPGPEAAAATVALLNLLWDVEVGPLRGRDVIDEFTQRYIAMERPLGSEVNRSYTIYNLQRNCHTMVHDDFVKLVESREYVMEASSLIGFVEEVRALVQRIKETEPLIAVLNLRLTRGTRATLGMQQFERSGYIEIWTIAGIDGNEAFYRALAELADRPGVVPHWGMFHRSHADGHETNFAREYDLEAWRRAMNFIAGASDTDPNTFRHGFVQERELLPDL